MTVAPLTDQLKTASRQVVTDGYDMSFGEIVSLYEKEELIIDPNYQRLFRWDESQKTRFVESILLGIPIPPIFVFQRENGQWELIDGLQRISTLLQLIGNLRTPEGGLYEPLVLGGTNLLPALDGMKWVKENDDDQYAFDTAMQLEVKRSRIRVEILRKESDQEAKYELFQRLNTGGSRLTEQEVRNSILIMLNKEFFEWLERLTGLPSFSRTIQLTETQVKQQQNVEIALRFVAYRRVPYRSGLDVNEYLDDAARSLANLGAPERDEERSTFEWVFNTLQQTIGNDVFKRWDGTRYTGKFLISGFDAIAYGVAINRPAIEAMGQAQYTSWIKRKVQSLWNEQEFLNNSGQGVRGTTRLTKLLPFGREYFTP